MPNFFVSKEQVIDSKIRIIGQDVNHIKNVLRLEKENDIVVTIKENEESYSCKINEINKEFIICDIIEKINYTTETKTYIHIFQGMPKADKLEFIIEKCTEIGVKEITPVLMKRSVVKLKETDISKKILRWRKIAEVAAKQSKRNKILQVNNVITFKNIFEKIKEYDIVLIAYEDEKNNTLKSVLKNINYNVKENKIAVLIGPEGGIDIQEIQELKNNINNINIVTLGKRTLRTETAPIVISSNILYELEED